MCVTPCDLEHTRRLMPHQIEARKRSPDILRAASSPCRAMPFSLPRLSTILVLYTAIWKCDAIIKEEIRSNIKYYAVSKGERPGDLVLSEVETAGELENVMYLPEPESALTVLLHGLGGSQNHSFTQRMANALLRLGKENIMVADYERLVPTTDYEAAVRHSAEVGRELAGFLADLSLPLELIGFSLGAHVAAVAGHTLATVYNQTLARITGLDPAFPTVGELEKSERLDPSDAEFVVVVHTASGTLGSLQPQGHLDFYPNGGMEPQPHCRIPRSSSHSLLGIAEMFEAMCSHSASYIYMSESVDGGYTATRCSSWGRYRAGGCEGEPTLHMSLTVPPRSRGLYFLETRQSEPFGEPTDYETEPPDWEPVAVPVASQARKQLDGWDLLNGLAIFATQVFAIYIIWHYTPY